MRPDERSWSEHGALVVAGCLAGLLGCAEPEQTPTVPPPDREAVVSVESRSSYWPTFPCTQCHEHRPGTANPRERELSEFHTRTNDLDHGELEGWCYRCHAQENVDLLVLADARRVPFDRGYEHCGACHGEKLVDWRAGIHGLTTGQWNGPRLRRSCTHCHDPHQPSFPTMEALPLEPTRGASRMIEVSAR